MKNLLLSAIFLLFSSLAIAQPIVQWHRWYGGTADQTATAVHQTTDGGYVVAGYSTSNDDDVSGNHGESDFWVVKLDENGQIEWQKCLGGSDRDDAYSIQQTNDGGYIMAGLSNSSDGDVSSNYGDLDGWVVKLDETGNIVWQKSLGGPNDDLLWHIEQTTDGGYIASGVYHSNFDGLPNEFEDADAWVVKLDMAGNLQWQKFLGGDGKESAEFVQEDQTGGYIVAATANANGGQVSGNHGNIDSWLVKLDENGQLEWQKCLGGTANDGSSSLHQVDDGGYVLAGWTMSNDGDVSGNHGNMDFWVVKVDETGQLEWQKCLGGSNTDVANTMDKTSDGGYIVAGVSNSSDGDFTSNVGLLDSWVVKLNGTGDLIWQKNIGDPRSDQIKYIQETDDGGYIAAGYSILSNFNGNGLTSSYYKVVKFRTTDSALKGYVHLDPEHDCESDPTELPLSGWLVQAVGQSTFYAVTDAAGRYFMPIDPGDYQVSAVPPNSFWGSCNIPVAVQVMNDTLMVDFPQRPLIECPQLTIDIAVPFLRRCFDNTYTVQYCNQGTLTAEDAFVEVSLDAAMQFVSATLPVSSQNGNTLTFQLGDIAINTCGSFQITAYLGCDNTVLGQTHCTEAHIFPDSSCIQSNVQWDGSNIEVQAICTGDSVVFILHNTGAGDMSEQRQYIIIEDDLVLLHEEFQLDALQSLQVGVVAEGATLHLEAQQAPAHPTGFTSAGATIEGCNGWNGLGFFSQWPLNIPNLFVDIDCQPNIGSYDPNDKTAFPAGFGEERLIEQNQDLEYLLRFQNTGTDTAFKVVVMDVLPEELDLTTLRPGASSHPYTYSVTPEGRPLFIFDNILLPDSTTNQAASNGFVRFRIKQQPDLPFGTVIANTALIYFDFNEPVQTNTTIHRIGQIFPWDVVQTRYPVRSTSQVRVVPNPFNNNTFIQIERITPGQLKFALSNALGQVLRVEEVFGTEFEFQRGSLPGGLYFFRVEKNGVLVGNGKLVVQE